MNQVTFALNNPNAGTRLWREKEWAEGEILYAELRFVSTVAITPKAFSVTFSIPSVDMHSVWSPQTDANGMRKLGPTGKRKSQIPVLHTVYRYIVFCPQRGKTVLRLRYRT